MQICVEYVLLTVLLICVKNSHKLVFVFLSKAWNRPTMKFVVYRMVINVAMAH